MPYDSITDRNDAVALIPEEVSREIIKGVADKSVALSLMKQVPMSRKLYRMPVLSALPTAYFVSGDTGLKQTADLAWQNKYLTAEELAVIVPVPEAVIDDADYDIWGEARPLLEEAIASALDAAVLFGTNKPASWAESVEDFAAAASNAFVRGSVAGQDLAEDINAVMALVEADGYDVTGFVARKALKASLRGLRSATEKLPIFSPSLTAGTPGALYGEPIEYVKNNSAWDSARADLLAGDWSKGIIGVRQDFTFKHLDQAVITDASGNIVYNLAQQDMVAMRVVARYAWQVANPVNRANTTEATRSPFAVLRPTGFV